MLLKVKLVMGNGRNTMEVTPISATAFKMPSWVGKEPLGQGERHSRGLKVGYAELLLTHLPALYQAVRQKKKRSTNKKYLCRSQ